MVNTSAVTPPPINVWAVLVASVLGAAGTVGLVIAARRVLRPTPGPTRLRTSDKLAKLSRYFLLYGMLPAMMVAVLLSTFSPAAALLYWLGSLLTAGLLFLASRIAGRRELTQMRRRQRALGQTDTPPPLSPLTVATLYAIAAFFTFAVVLIAAVTAFPPRSDADPLQSPFMWCCMTTVVLLGAGGYLLYRRAQARWARWERGVSQPPPALID